MMSLRLFTCVAASLMAATICTAETIWTDVTGRFLKNPTFDNDQQEPWTWESNASTQAVRVECVSFYSGNFDMHQQLSGLPKGRYRLSVQAFYRMADNNTSYNAHQNGSEQLVANLYAGNISKTLVSLYDESMDYNAAGRCFTPDNQHYYPDGKEAALEAFEMGQYVNTLEFDAQGSIQIGIRCQNNESNNYCVIDNFKLEYQNPVDSEGKSWIDMTHQLLTNPSFDDNDQSGWNHTDAGQTVRVECMEYYNSNFNIWQEVKGAKNGRYRLSVQAFYRCQDNNADYQNYQNNTQDITGYLYAGDQQQQLVSVYSESMNTYTDGVWSANSWGGWWGRNPPYFPNDMESARVFFDNELYWNELEFEADGDFRIGLRCDKHLSSNWCIFDNFRLEYYGDMVTVKEIKFETDHAELVSGESVELKPIISPADATVTWLEWSSSNEEVATVDDNGIVTAWRKGTAVISATATDGSGTKGSLTVTVISNPATKGTLVVNEIMASNIDEYISPAFNFDGWIELYNPTDRTVELNGLVLSDPANGERPWTMPQDIGVVPAKGYKVIWFDSNDIEPHNAPFKLDTDGGSILISDESGTEIVRQDYPASMERISYARFTDGAEEWGYTGTPTPGASNNGIKLLKSQLAAPVVDQPSQLFTGMLSVNVTIPGGCTLRYTTDGSLPTLTNGETSKTGQFTVGETSNYRFRLYADDMLPSRVTTRSYIVREMDFMLPVVSVVTDNDFLYSKEIGVMEKGPNGRPGNGQSSKCNWNMNWERPVNFSYLDANGEMVLNQDVNLEMCGGWSRAWTPHAFKLKGSKELGGEKNLYYPFFDQKPYIRNRTLQIRNGGNDNNCRFKDASLAYIVQTSGLDVDVQSYQPVHEFINGKYIGVLNVREPNNKHYVYANYGWDDDEIDQWEMSPDSGYIQKCGTPDAYNELVDDLSPNAADANTYKEICRLLDIDEFINYMAVQFFYAGNDWPRNNVKAFRHRDDGRFRFVLFDVDAAFSYGTDVFDQFMWKETWTFDELYPRSLGRITAQIRLVTLFRNLLENETFRSKFIDTYCIVAGSVFEKDRSREILDYLYNRVEPAMRLNGGSATDSYNKVKNSLSSRLNTAINAIKNYSGFGLTSATPYAVRLQSDTPGAVITINGLALPTGQFNGKLFNNPIINAISPIGYSFKGWFTEDGVAYSTRADIPLPSSDINLVASFSPLSQASKQRQNITPVRINEVSGSNNSFIDEYGKKSDWVELYNTTDEPIDIEGMYLTDNLSKPTKYQITKNDTRANTIIPAHGHLIIWCDNKNATTDKGLHASFKIDGNGGQLQLMAADQSWKDVVYFGAHDARTTICRYPDGGAKVYTTNVATIGYSNSKTSYMTTVEQVPTDVAMHTVSNANGLRVFYASQQVLVKSDEADVVNVAVYRADGQLATHAQIDVKGGTARVSVSELAHGFYVARVTNSDGTTVSCKFMK